MSRADEFAEFVHARSTALHRAAYLMVGEVSLAQDLVQEALVKTYAAISIWTAAGPAPATSGWTRTHWHWQ